MSYIILHWSASGEVLVHDEMMGWQKLSIANGDGLPPLTLGDLEAGDECRGTTCSFHTAAGLIAIVDGESSCIRDAAYVLLAEDRQTLCTAAESVITWNDVEEAGGLSLIRSWSDRTRISAMRCGRRKWQPCSGNASTD